MRFFRHPQAPHRVSEPITLPLIDIDQIVREEFETADRLAGTHLDRVRRQGTIVVGVEVDDHRGSARLRFADGTRFRLAAAGEAITQLEAAATLADTRLVYSQACQGTPGRVLIFTAAHWTVYLKVDVVHVELER